MPKGTNQKLKLYRLAQIMLENTDDEHYITMPEIMEELGKYEVTADRKTIYADLRDLSVLGIEVEGEPIGNRYHYRVVNRPFELPELKLLVDSIQSSKFITEKKSNQLIHKIEQLASRHEAQTLQRQVVVSNRIKTMNESIFYNIDKLHSAISSDVKITFKYCSWTLAKKLEPKKDGANYTVSPYILVWDDENYYLIAFDHDAGEIRHYRVDKMDSLVQTDLPREGKQLFDDRFDAAAYSRKVFGMFSGEEKTVKLKCLNRFIGVMLDRFGSSLRLFPADNEHFYLDVDVVVSPQFFSWVFSLEGDVRIVDPPEVCKAFEKQIHKFID